MLLLTFVLGAPAIAQAVRIVPEAAGLARPAFGVHQLPHQPMTALHATADMEDAPDPFGVRAQLQLGNRRFDEAERVSGWELEPERIKGRGGAPIETWRVDKGTKGSKLVKRIKVKTEQDRFAFKNEMKALLAMAPSDVFLTVEDAWAPDVESFGLVVNEFALMTEDYAGTMRDVLKQNKGKLDGLTALDFFSDIAEDLFALRLRRIAHDSPLAEEVLIVGPHEDVSKCRAVLCSSLANTNMRICGQRPSLEKLLESRGLRLPKSPKVDKRTTADIEEADFASLDRLLDDLLEALPEEENKKFLDMLESMKVSKTSRSLSRRMYQVRKEWVRKEGADRSAVRVKRRTPLVRLMSLKHSKDDASMDAVQTAIVDDVLSTEDQESEASADPEQTAAEVEESEEDETDAQEKQVKEDDDEPEKN